MRGALLFNVSAPLWDRTVHLRVAVKTEIGLAVVQPLSFQDVQNGARIDGEPTLAMSPEEAQALVDALWDAGVRPSSGQGSAGQLAAVNDHLQDMRRLVFEVKP